MPTNPQAKHILPHGLTKSIPLSPCHVATDLFWDTGKSLSFFLPGQEKERELSPPLTHLPPHTESVMFSSPQDLEEIGKKEKPAVRQSSCAV